MKFNVILAGLLFMVACGKSEDKKTECDVGQSCYVRETSLNVENIGTSDTGRSHNQGMNCMTCHQERGPGKGLFSVAGTIVNADGTSAKGAKIVVYKDEARTEEVLTVEVDKLGNFYTTEKAPFPADAYPVMVSADGSKRIQMPFSTASGACNMCHVGRQALKFK